MWLLLFSWAPVLPDRHCTILCLTDSARRSMLWNCFLVHLCNRLAGSSEVRSVPRISSKIYCITFKALFTFLWKYRDFFLVYSTNKIILSLVLSIPVLQIASRGHSSREWSLPHTQLCIEASNFAACNFTHSVTEKPISMNWHRTGNQRWQNSVSNSTFILCISYPRPINLMLSFFPKLKWSYGNSTGFLKDYQRHLKSSWSTNDIRLYLSNQATSSDR